MLYVTTYPARWIVIFLLDSAIQRLINLSQLDHF